MRTTLAALLVLTATFAHAEWIPVSQGNDRIMYVDSSVRSSGRLTVVWSLIDHSAIQKEAGDSYLSSTGQWEIDCASRIMRQVYHSIHSGRMGGGSTVWSGALTRNFQPVAPGSLGEGVAQAACR
jgi:hypothetical protein